MTMQQVKFAWTIALVLACLLGAAAPARADLASGLKAFEDGDFETAQRELLPLRDDAQAAFALGVMADFGEGMEPDPAAAARFYATAVQAGHIIAMTNLGMLYDNGRGVARDGATAQQLYIAAARGDDIDGKNNLAYLWGRQNSLLEEALCLSAQTIRAQPHESAYLDTYGFILLRLGRLDDAERFFRKAVEENQDDPIATEHLGDIAQLRGDSARARDQWQQALDLAGEEHDTERLQRKLAGKPSDLDEHPPFRLNNGGFGKECAMPNV